MNIKSVYISPCCKFMTLENESMMAGSITIGQVDDNQPLGAKTNNFLFEEPEEKPKKDDLWSSEE